MYFFTIFHCFHSEYLFEIELFTIGKGMHQSPYLDHMELSALAFIEVIHQFCDQSQLFEGRGEDGVLAEVYLIFIDLQTLSCLKQSEGTFVSAFLFPFILHQQLLSFKFTQSFNPYKERVQDRVGVEIGQKESSFHQASTIKTVPKRDHSFLMLYKPQPEYHLTAFEEEIYRRIIDRHRKYVNEKYILPVFKSSMPQLRYKLRTKSRFYEEDKESFFRNTLLNQSNQEGKTMTLAELEQIPAQDFMDLCEKVQKMTIDKKEKSITPIKMGRSACKGKATHSRMLNHRSATPQNFHKASQISLKKLLPRFPKIGHISSRQFFQLFMKKSKQAEKINQIKEQIELEVQHQTFLKVEAIMDQKKTAKQQTMNLQLVTYFRGSLMESVKLGNVFIEKIDNKIPKLRQELSEQAKTSEKEQKKMFSIQGIRMGRNYNRIQVFEKIKIQIKQFIQRINEYFQGELVTPLPIYQLKPLIDVYNTSVRQFSLSANSHLGIICQQFFMDQNEKSRKQYQLPKSASIITNEFSLKQLKKIHQQFMSYKYFLKMLFEHMERILDLKDLITETGRKGRASITILRNTATNIRIQ